jgi:hypothetical protein
VLHGKTLRSALSCGVTKPRSAVGRFVGIETMWKPLPKYAQKPWTVRALQLVAAAANNGNGTQQC